jgi:hypothetical protein
MHPTLRFNVQQAVRLLFLLCCPVLIYAQIPDKFTNLQVLPKDISKQELVQTMKGFTADLGVRCVYCHVGEEGKPFSEFNFPSDDKKTKGTARVMLRMREAINTQFIPQLGEPEEKMVTVHCGTCHHGLPIPMTLEDVLFTSITNQGRDSCFAKYRALRKAYYGRASYDFGEFSLQNLADRLDREKARTDDAIAILKFNIQFFPESGSTYAGLGELYAKKGDKVQARANLEKAFNILHDPRIKKRIEQLSGK